MNLLLPTEAEEYSAAVHGAVAAAGGTDLARRAEVDPTVRTAVVEPLLEELGIRDIAVAQDPVPQDPLAFIVAAELCRAAGNYALPYPLASAIVTAVGDRPPVLLPGPGALVNHADVFAEWAAVDLDGSARAARRSGDRLASRLGPFVGTVERAEVLEPLPIRSVATLLTLDTFWIVGVLEAALRLAIQHVTGRTQFGRRLADFQVVQFQIADADVAVRGLRELGWFTSWRLADTAPVALGDALAFRLFALEGAQLILRTAHQLHGAVGFCDEHDLSVLSRHVQPTLRLALGSEDTTDALLHAIESEGFDALFG